MIVGDPTERAAEARHFAAGLRTAGFDELAALLGRLSYDVLELSEQLAAARSMSDAHGTEIERLRMLLCRRGVEVGRA